jgi:hypothetical protein
MQLGEMTNDAIFMKAKQWTLVYNRPLIGKPLVKGKPTRILAHFLEIKVK